MPSDVIYVENPIGFRAAFQSWTGPVGTHLRTATEAVRVAAAVSAPKKTGELAAGHETTYDHHRGDLESHVVAIPKHAIFVIKGTNPHIIVPKKLGGRLVFFWPKVGHVVALRKVTHPGNLPNDYLGSSLKKVMKRFA